jgi:hypothetical protein
MDLWKQEWTRKVDGRNDKEWGEMTAKNGSKGKWGRDSIDQGGQREESMPRRRGVQRGEWEADGRGDWAAEETGNSDDRSRGDEGSRGENEREMAEETGQRGRLAAVTTDLEGKCECVGGGDEASEVSWTAKWERRKGKKWMKRVGVWVFMLRAANPGRPSDWWFTVSPSRMGLNGPHALNKFDP